jgi:AcrR family transcriptional regulator
MSKPEKIIDAARKRFRYYGIGKTTMQEIAADAGVAVGTLYLYFSNKDELVVACAEVFAERHRAEAEAILAADSRADEKLRQYIVGRFRQSEETRTSSRHAAEIARAVLRVKPDRIQEEAMMIWDTVGRILKLGARQRLFVVADPEQDAKVFLFSIAGFFPNALADPPIEPRLEDLLLVIDWFVKAWKKTPAKKTRKKKQPH